MKKTSQPEFFLKVNTKIIVELARLSQKLHTPEVRAPHDFFYRKTTQWILEVLQPPWEPRSTIHKTN